MTSVHEFHSTWDNLPLGSLDDIIGGGTCLVLAPHPDDESLGCGGLIAACVASGRSPVVAVLTDGAGSHPDSSTYPSDRLRAIRANEVRTAVQHLGLPAHRLILLNQPDTAAPHDGPRFDDVVERLTQMVRAEPRCTAILSTWRHDPHCDHEAASRVAEAVALQTDIRHVAFPIWGWTLPSGTEIEDRPTPGWRLDIRPFLPAKRAAVRAHRSQFGDLIDDDPNAFHLPSALLKRLDGPYETFLQT